MMRDITEKSPVYGKIRRVYEEFCDAFYRTKEGNLRLIRDELDHLSDFVTFIGSGKISKADYKHWKEVSLEEIGNEFGLELAA